jgi:2-polyprenyl-3-methyl-5-hydroxy-6-metoxy-1,4-benzoquinol methylase
MTITNAPARTRYFSTHFHRYQSPAMDDGTFRFYADLFAGGLPPDRDARILEIGCGLGKFLATLRRLGYRNVTGIDVSEEMVEHAAANFDGPVLLVEDPVAHLRSQAPGSWERIYMLDVIEHVDKTRVVELLEAVRAALTPGGRIVVTTENMASPVGRIQRYLDFTHEYNYTEFTLRQVLEIAGFRGVEVRGLPDPFPGRPWAVLTRPRTVARWAATRAWHRLLRYLHELERPDSVVPTIWGKELIGSGEP